MAYFIDIVDIQLRCANLIYKILKGDKSGRHPILPADQIRTDRQSQDRQVTWPHHRAAHVLARADDVIE